MAVGWVGSGWIGCSGRGKLGSSRRYFFNTVVFSECWMIYLICLMIHVHFACQFFLQGVKYGLEFDSHTSELRVVSWTEKPAKRLVLFSCQGDANSIMFKL